MLLQMELCDCDLKIILRYRSLKVKTSLQVGTCTWPFCRVSRMKGSTPHSFASFDSGFSLTKTTFLENQIHFLGAKIVFMPLTSMLRGHIGLGLSICLSLCPSVIFGYGIRSRTSRDRILKLY